MTDCLVGIHLTPRTDCFDWEERAPSNRANGPRFHHRETFEPWLHRARALNAPGCEKGFGVGSLWGAAHRVKSILNASVDCSESTWPVSVTPATETGGFLRFSGRSGDRCGWGHWRRRNPHYLHPPHQGGNPSRGPGRPPRSPSGAPEGGDSELRRLCR